MFPDFIGIGAQKSGSTWLDRGLEAHPEIWMPPRKEIHYFDRSADWVDPPNKVNRSFHKSEFRKLSREGLREFLWTRKFRKTPRTDEWYASLFRPGRRQISGEITPEYALLGEEKVARVHRLMPEAKILFVLRNPVERTWSHALMDFQREGRNAGRSPLSELDEFAARAYVERKGLYLDTLKTWNRFYPAERIFVGFLEDINFNPRPFMESVYGFLGVRTDFKAPKPGKKVNARSGGTMPTDAARMLAGKYRRNLEELSSVFGGYASFWLYCAGRLLVGEQPDKPPEERERTGNPMSRSPLWDDWTRTLPAGVGPKPEDFFMSMPLSDFEGWSRKPD